MFALGLALGACKAAPSPDSGVDGDKLADALTPAEQIEVCQAIERHVDEVLPPAEAHRAGCTFAGIVGALAIDSTPMTCETLRKNCLTKRPAPMAAASCDVGITWSDCEATVAEIEDCREEHTEAYAEVMRGFACNKMEEYKIATPTTDVEIGEACILARAKCPTVLGKTAGDV